MEEARWQEIKMLKDKSLHEYGLVIPDYPEHSFSYVMLDGVALWGFTYRVLMDYLNKYYAS